MFEVGPRREHLKRLLRVCRRVMAEVMLEEIGRRPGAATKEEEDQPGLSSSLHKVRRSLPCIPFACHAGAALALCRGTVHGHALCSPAAWHCL